MVELDADALAFIDAEGASAIAQIPGSDLDTTIVAAILSRVEGWAAGSVLAAIVSLDAARACDGAYLSVADGRLYIATGCNRGFGDLTVSATAVEVGPIALTRMACETALDDWEQTLTVFLTGSLDYVVNGSAVTLTNGTQTLTLNEIPAP